MKIGFIGKGNMATAMITQLKTKKNYEIYVAGRTFVEKYALKHGIHAAKNNEELVLKSAVIILAVKPDVIPTVLGEIRDALVPGKQMIISIAAGVSLKQLAAAIGKNEIPFMRAMPNLNARIGEATSAIVENSVVDRTQLQCGIELFETIGHVYSIPEKDFSTFTAIAGSSPAFVFEFIDAMSRAALSHGMPKQLATEIAASAVSGSAKLLLEAKTHPWEMIDKVSSPGGTTVAGTRKLHETGFYNSVMQAIDAVIEKDSRKGTDNL